MLTEISPGLLAGAFPSALRGNALEAARIVHGRMDTRQWADLLPLNVGDEVIHIPRRLRFTTLGPASPLQGSIGQMISCLQTQSFDGFHRQRALQHILTEVQPWSAPFVVTLIGEYVIEIIDDIDAALSEANKDVLVSFINDNPNFWETTKRRVASYWNVYYRGQYTRQNYRGFQLIGELEAKLREGRQ